MKASEGPKPSGINALSEKVRAFVVENRIEERLLVSFDASTKAQRALADADRSVKPGLQWLFATDLLDR